jgi:selenocysteine-specific elongation factor
VTATTERRCTGDDMASYATGADASCSPMVSETIETSVARIVVATGGHVDHGKTTLIHALTGIDCDRLAEEKRRGMTIDIGFAHWTDDNVQVSVVDVPGHAQYTRNAMAGFAGAKLMLLVVAADEGVRVQTREHLEIGSALRIPYGLVVISKADLVSSDRLNEVRREIADLVSDTVFATQEPIAVSAVNGMGLSELRGRVVRLAKTATNTRGTERRFRYAVDRCFHIRGQGVITTGTVLGGRVRAGDRIRLLPSAAVCRVRGIQVHGGARDMAVAGERASLQVSGLERDEIARGDVFEEPTPTSSVTASVVARIRMLGDAVPATSRRIEVRVHAYAAERQAWLMFADKASNAERLVVLRMVERIPLCRGDRLVLFRASPQTLLGGGEVLDPMWPGRRRGSLQGVSGTLSEAFVEWVCRADWRGMDEETLTTLAGEAPSETADHLNALVNARMIRVVPGSNPRVFVAQRSYASFVERVKAVLESRRSEPGGIPVPTLLSLLAPADTHGTGSALLKWMALDGIVYVADGLVLLESDRVAVTEQRQLLMKRVLDLLLQRQFAPPPVSEIAHLLELSDKDTDDAIKRLVSGGDVVKVDADLLVARETLTSLESAISREFDVVDVGAFKQRFGLTRRFAIPLLEYLDRRGITQRNGGVRVVRSKSRCSENSQTDNDKLVPISE